MEGCRLRGSWDHPDDHQHHAHVQSKELLPFIVLNPSPETSLELLDLRCRDLKLYADLEVDQVNKVGEVLRLLGLVSQEDWCKV